MTLEIAIAIQALLVTFLVLCVAIIGAIIGGAIVHYGSAKAAFRSAFTIFYN